MLRRGEGRLLSSFAFFDKKLLTGIPGTWYNWDIRFKIEYPGMYCTGTCTHVKLHVVCMYVLQVLGTYYM